MKKLVRDRNPDKGAPELIEMSAVDAHHAVLADPKRYSIEEDRPVLPPLSLEQRIARIENRLGPETPEEIEHRNRRNREIAERASEEREARKAERQPVEPELSETGDGSVE
jgi:hypothetical protein